MQGPLSENNITIAWYSYLVVMAVVMSFDNCWSNNNIVNEAC
jgi:hypothetical protein